MKYKKFIKAQSLFEVVVAVAMGALIITAIVGVAANSIQNSSFSRDKTLASNYVDQINEWLREQRDYDANNFYTKVNASNVYCFTDLNWSHPHACSLVYGTDMIASTKFKREVSFQISQVNPPGKNLVSVSTNVWWSDSKGKHTVTGSTYLSPSAQ